MTFFRSTILFSVASVLLAQTPPPPGPASQVHPAMPPIQMMPGTPTVEAPKVAPDHVVITVGDLKITAGQLDALIDSLSPQVRSQARGPNRRAFAENIVKMLTLAIEAQKRQMENTPEFKAQVQFQTWNLLANALATQVSQDVQVTDADVRQYYEMHKNEFDTVQAKHILIRFKGSQVPLRPGEQELTDEEALAKAKEIRQKIQGGADFATLAKAESDDAGSGAKGGELPPFHHGQMVAPFEAAAFSLKPGELSEPVKSQFGYHIILVVSHSTFDDVKADVEKRVKPEQGQKAVTKFIDDLEKTTPAVLDPTYFPPPPTPPVMPPAPIKPPDKK